MTIVIRDFESLTSMTIANITFDEQSHIELIVITFNKFFNSIYI